MPEGMKAGEAWVDLHLRDNLAIGFAKAKAAMTGMGATLSTMGVAMTAAITVPILGIGAAGMASAKTLGAGYRIIARATGAMGETLEGLKKDFREVFKDVPSSAEDTAKAISGISQRLGLSGKPLQELSKSMLNLARVSKTEIEPLIQSMTRVFGDWSISTGKQNKAMDYMWKVSHQTGISVDELGRHIVRYGAPLRQLGFDFETSAALMGKFEKEGVNLQLVMGSMRIALGKMAKQGIEDPVEALKEMIKRIREAGSTGKANALSLEMFGAKAGPDMAAAIREGRFDLDKLLESLGNSKETINGASDSTLNFTEALAKMKNKIVVALEPLGAPMLKLMKEDLRPALEGLVTVLVKAGKAFSDLPEPVRRTIMGLALALAVIGPLIGIFGGLITSVVTAIGFFASLFTIANLVNIALAALFLLVAGAGAIFAGFVIKEVIDNWGTWKGLIDRVKDSLAPLKDRFLELKKKWNEDWKDLPIAEKIKNALVEASKTIQEWWNKGLRVAPVDPMGPFEKGKEPLGPPAPTRAEAGKDIWADIVKQAKGTISDAWFEMWNEIFSDKARWENASNQALSIFFNLGKKLGEYFVIGLVSAIAYPIQFALSRLFGGEEVNVEANARGNLVGMTFLKALFAPFVGLAGFVAGVFGQLWGLFIAGLPQLLALGQTLIGGFIGGMAFVFVTLPTIIGTWLFDNIITPIASFLLYIYNKGMEVITNFIGGMALKVVELGGRVLSWLNNQIIYPITNFLGTIWSKGSELMGRFIESLAVKISSLGSRVSKWIYTQIITPIKDRFTDLYDRGKSLIQSFFDGISDVWNKNSTIKSIVEWIGKTLGGLGGAFKGAGDSIGKKTGDSLSGWNKAPSSAGQQSSGGKVKYPLLGIGAGGHKLAAPAAGAFRAMARAGMPVQITDSFRTFAQQVDLKARKPGLAANPSSSHHEEGMAIDVGPSTASWLNTFGRAFGWIRDKKEWWHFNFAGVPAFGHGAFVKEPTLALIGDRGPEWVVPDDKMRQSMMSNRELHLYIGTLVADDLGLKKLEEKLKGFRIMENQRLGLEFS